MRAKLVLLAPLLAGCPDRSISGVSVDQGRVEAKFIPAVLERDLDILFQIDTSGSMLEEQQSLRNNFGRFIDVLESLEIGLPNVHIAVSTPDLGTSATDGTNKGMLGGCNGTGEAGALRKLPGTALTFLRDVDNGAGGRTRNYTGTLTERFAELATVGTAGCGIEQHLEALKRTLDANPANAGFLRPNAALAVIVIADEDDCSLANTSIFTGDPTSDPLWGEKANFKCTKEGVVCESPSTDLSVVGPRMGCSANDASTMNTKLDRYEDFLRGLKQNPKKLIMAGILGDHEPFEIFAKPVSGSTTSALKPSCEYAGATGIQYAYPAVRTRELIERFPGQNTVTTICDSDLSGALVDIGRLIVDAVGNPCFLNPLSDADPATPGTQYECAVTELQTFADGTNKELATVPACDDGRTRIPCWRIEADPEGCKHVETDPKLKLIIERGGVPPREDYAVSASCVTVTPDLR